MYYLRILDGSRAEFIAHMKAIDIDVGIHWTPGHQFSSFRICRAATFRDDLICEQIVTLPFHSHMKPEDTDRVMRGQGFLH
jgi:dTDP-4-amino-4,6-dideoxygalactose transaminase